MINRNEVSERQKIEYCITNTFLTINCDYDSHVDAQDDIVDAVEKFENTYNAITTVKFDNGCYRINIYPARSADDAAIKRGVDNIYHWLKEASEK